MKRPLAPGLTWAATAWRPCGGSARDDSNTWELDRERHRLLGASGRDRTPAAPAMKGSRHCVASQLCKGRRRIREADYLSSWNSSVWSCAESSFESP